MTLSELRQRRIDLCLEASSSEKWFEALKHARRARQLDKALQVHDELSVKN
jgi:hypothetical protein